MAKFSSINFGMVLATDEELELLTKFKGLKAASLRLGNTWLVGGGIMVSSAWALKPDLSV